MLAYIMYQISWMDQVIYLGKIQNTHLIGQNVALGAISQELQCEEKVLKRLSAIAEGYDNSPQHEKKE